MVEVSHLSGRRTGVTAPELPGPLENPLRAITRPRRHCLARQPERLIHPPGIPGGNPLLAPSSRHLQHDHRPLLGRGLRGSQQLGANHYEWQGHVAVVLTVVSKIIG